MLLYRPEEHEGEDSALIEVIVAKNRAGPKGTRTLVHDKKYFRLQDWAGPDPDWTGPDPDRPRGSDR